MSELEQIEKQYYSIGEVAEMLKVNASLIRFWETEFDHLHPKKNKKGNRIYKKEDIEVLKNIYYLVKVKGYTLKGAKDTLKKKPDQVSMDAKTRDTLLKVKGFLTELKQAL